MEAVLNWSSGIDMTEKAGIKVLDTDAQLMLRFKDGDAKAFDSLFTKHMRAMVNFAYRFVRNREIAEELAQEIFLKVYENAAGYRPQAKFTTWLYRIATNVCLNEIRRPSSRAAHQPLNPKQSNNPNDALREVEDRAIAGPDRLFEQRALAQILKQALDQIPEKQRIAFILNKYQELSYVEVADIMRISEKAVKSLIHRAKGALAERLQPLLPELLLK
jgi:RNA polymerase sigma-70 factor (ECF subfamily)